jgi:hypothetical protein
MRRVMRAISMAGVLILAGASMARAQSNEGFGAGYLDVGPVIGIGGVGSASISYGGRFEYGIEQLPSLGNGILSVAASVDHYSYNSFNFGFSYTPIGATVNYHFHLDNRQLDPFVGVGLGDYIVTTPSNCPGCSFNSGIYFIGRAGLRYFVAPSLALYADVGSGAGSLHIGVMFKLKGAE